MAKTIYDPMTPPSHPPSSERSSTRLSTWGFARYKGRSCVLASSTLTLHILRYQSNWWSPSFSNTPFQNFLGISDLPSEVPNFQHHTRTKLCSEFKFKGVHPVVCMRKTTTWFSTGFVEPNGTASEVSGCNTDMLNQWFRGFPQSIKDQGLF
jgi:hypothetical protein